LRWWSPLESRPFPRGFGRDEATRPQRSLSIPMKRLTFKNGEIRDATPDDETDEDAEGDE